MKGKELELVVLRLPLHSSLFTLHSSLFTLHSSLFTLYPFPFTPSQKHLRHHSPDTDCKYETPDPDDQTLAQAALLEHDH